MISAWSRKPLMSSGGSLFFSWMKAIASVRSVEEADPGVVQHLPFAHPLQQPLLTEMPQGLGHRHA